MDTSDIIALYLRISLKNKNTGDSIENQRSLLQNYICLNNEFKQTIIKEFIDDGYSGTNFERPAIQELLQLARQKKIRCIIVKDISRFGRTYIEVGNYLEYIFPYLKIRFISVNDNYDSNKNINGCIRIDLSFKNILNSYTSYKLSQDVLQTKRNLAKEGKFLAPKPPYGYLMNPENRYKLIVDENTKNVVKLIFAMYLKEHSSSDIAKILNSKKIESPAQRLYNLGIKNGYYNETNIKKSVWTTEAILKILRNPVVIGTVRNHILERKEYGKKKLKKVNKDEIILVHNKHEAIIKKNDFEKVQNILALKQRVIYNYSGGKEDLFKGKLFCAECNNKIRLEKRYQKWSYYRCDKRDKNTLHKVSIRYELLIDKVIEELTKYKEKFSHIKKESNTKKEIQEKNLVKDSIKVLEQKKKELKNTIANFYEQYANKLITQEEFISKKQSLQNAILEIQQELDKRYKSEKEKYAINSQTILVNQNCNLKEAVEGYIKDIYLYKDESIKINWLV